jgi:hypothetical protein
MEREYKCVGIDRYHRGRKCGYGLVPWCPALTAYAKRPAALLPIYGLSTYSQIRDGIRRRRFKYISVKTLG